MKSGIGDVSAWKLSPTVDDASGPLVRGGNIAIWMSDDTRRLPVKLQSGPPRRRVQADAAGREIVR